MSCVNSCGFLNYKCWLLGKELCRDETLAEQDVATYPSSISKTCTENCDLVAKCHTFLVDKERLTCDGDKNAGFNGLDAVSQGVKTPADVCFFHGAITAEEHNAINFNYVLTPEQQEQAKTRSEECRQQPFYHQYCMKGCNVESYDDSTPTCAEALDGRAKPGCMYMGDTETGTVYYQDMDIHLYFMSGTSDGRRVSGDIVANPYQKLYKDNRKDENVGKNLWKEVVERVKVEWPNAKENQYGKMRIDKS